MLYGLGGYVIKDVCLCVIFIFFVFVCHCPKMRRGCCRQDLSESTEVLAGCCEHGGVEEEAGAVPAAGHQVSPGQAGRQGGGEEGGRGGQAGGQHVRVPGPSQAVLGRAG